MPTAHSHRRPHFHHLSVLCSLKGHTKSNKKNYAAYAFFFVFILSVYHLFSDGDFSFLMTLGSMSSAFAFVMLFWKMLTQNNAAGVSAKSLQMYSLVFLFRFLSIYWHEGYLPFDKSGDWIYPAMEFLSLTMCGTALFLIFTKYSDSYKPALDTFGAMDPVPPQFGTVFLVVPALLIALLVHPSLNNVWWSDVCWTFALYLEAVAILPQLYMFQKGDGSSGTQKRVESFVSHFVFSLGFSRLLNLVSCGVAPELYFLGLWFNPGQPPKHLPTVYDSRASKSTFFVCLACYSGFGFPRITNCQIRSQPILSVGSCCWRRCCKWF